ncbi:hypothetical protein GEMRC1_001776 [Eukaryota sp. GEM-RC1]
MSSSSSDYESVASASSSEDENDSYNYNEVVSEPNEEEQTCLSWLQSLMKLSVDPPSVQLSLKQRDIILQFVRGRFATLYLYHLNQSRIISPEPPSKVHSEIIYFIALSQPLNPTNIFKSVQHGSVNGSSAITSLLKLMSSIYVPAVTHNKTWPEAMKSEFLAQLQKFMAVLTETVYAPQGQTVLFVPDEDVSSPESASLRKDLVQRLEATVIYWTRQIHDVVSSQEVFEAAESQGPLAELAFWKGRVADLEGIRKQIEEKGVQDILSVLDYTQSTYLVPFKSLARVIRLKYSEAENNLKFLSTLIEPCEELADVDLESFPSLLSVIITRVRLIWEYSKYYCTSKRISGLLRRITNDVITRCRGVIDLRDLFGLAETPSKSVNFADNLPSKSTLIINLDGYESVQRLVTVLTKVIEVNNNWKHLFNSTVSSISENASSRELTVEQYGVDSKLWDFDESPIFAQVDAFIQRCRDLIDICTFYLQFTACGRMLDDSKTSTEIPGFAGARARLVEGSLLSVEQSFVEEMEAILHLQSVVLDVRNSNWYEGYSQFKTAIKDLESVFVNTAYSAFDDVVCVNEAVALVNTFQHIAVRDSLKRLVERKIGFVFQLFMTEVSEIRKEFENLRRSPSYPAYMPRYAGSAFWATGLINKLQESLHSLELLPVLSYPIASIKEASESKQHFFYVSSLINDYVQGLYTEWKDLLSSPTLPAKLENPLLKRSEDDPELVESNFDPVLLEHFYEIYYWGLLKFDIPFPATPLIRHSQRLYVLREYVETTVREYNFIKSSLNDRNQGLLADRLSDIEELIKPAFDRHNWLSRNVVEYVKDSHTVCSGTTDVVVQFNDVNKEISSICESITKCTGIVLERKRIYSYDSYIKAQERFRGDCFGEILMYQKQIRSLMENLSQFFTSSSNKVLQEWNEFVCSVDAQLEQSLSLMIVNSINGLAASLQGTITKNDEFSEVQPVFKCLFDSRGKDSDDVPSYFSALSSNESIKKLVSSLLQSIASSETKTTSFINSWSLKYSHIWTDVQQPNLNDCDNIIDELDRCDADIRSYKQFKMQIQNEDTLYHLLFFRIDASRLKNLLINWCDDWVGAFTSTIHTEAKTTLFELFKYFKDKEAELREKPLSLEMLSKSLADLATVRNELPVIESSFEPIHKQYKLIQSHQVEITELETERLESLSNNWVEFNTALRSIDHMLAQSKSRFKESLLENFQVFKKGASSFRSIFEEKAPFSRTSVVTTSDALSVIDDFRSQLGVHVDKEEHLRRGLDLFEVEAEDQSCLTTTKAELELLEEIWSLQIEWDKYWDQWKLDPFSSLSVDDVDVILSQLHKRLHKLGKQIKHWGIWMNVKEKVSEFKRSLPLITDLRNPALRDRHWKRLQDLVGHVFDPKSADFTLEKVFQFGLHQVMDDISALSTAASQELAIENTLTQVKTTWTDLRVETSRYKSDFYRIKSIEEVTSTLEDHNVTLSTMKGSKYVTAFLRQVEEWDKILNTIMETLDLWLSVQRQWLYMESIFSSGDAIARQLPNEARLFGKINTTWKFLMDRLIKEHDCIAWKATHVENLWEVLSQTNSELEQIQKSLDDYLETKRMAFPRFYFLSNDDLLEILGQAKDPSTINKHLKKFFMAASHLQINPPGKDGRRHHEIVGMWSLENEYLRFTAPPLADGPVELWLGEVERAMQISLQKYLKDSLISLKPNALKREKWIQTWLGQLIIGAGQLLWTSDVTRALQELDNGGNPNSLKILRKRQIMLLNRMTAMVRGDLTPLNREKLIALITIEVHARDVIQKLISTGTSSPNEFEWTSQLRYYIENDKCYVQQNTAVLNYGYEYIGNSGRLVVTPLTDRCYMTLTTALEFKRGGSPQGPAGTGKTETVKDLAKALALIGIVFNCSEDFDYRSMGRIFMGLVQTGSWGCFDEFNRIDIEVLSVVAQQILSILSAVAQNAETFVFEGKRTPLKPSVGIFITMNPGYAGRTELPDNLKSLFRPVAMMRPDLALIAEISLFAEGFTAAKVLSKKLVTLFSLAAQQLSKQDHYDWGMRAVKAVLRAAGQLKRAHVDASEELLMLKALYDSNHPRLLAEDAVLFGALLGDLFPGIELEKLYIST